jgi:hypothetical protein
MKKCFASFHPLCARASGFKRDRHVSDGRPVIFCKTHSQDRWEEGRRVAAGKPAKFAKPAKPAKPAATATGDEIERAATATATATVGVDAHLADADARPDDLRGAPDKDKEHGIEHAGAETAKEKPPAPHARASAAVALWEGFAPFIASTRDRGRHGKLTRKILASVGVSDKETARLVALDASSGEAETRRAATAARRTMDAASRTQDARDHDASAPWSALRPHQRDGATRLTASHLAGLGSIVCDRVGAGKRLTILSHVLHLRDVVGVRGPHLVVC